jgi:GLPGLI family protein
VKYAVYLLKQNKMRNIYILIAVLLFDRSLGQNISGIITFEEKVKINIQTDKSPEATALLPKEQIFKKLLYFNPAASIYIADQSGEISDEIEQQSENGLIKIKMDHPDEKYYCDLQEKNMTSQRDLMGRKFIVEEDLTKSEWKLTGKEKHILNYACMEATKNESGRSISAWYTTAIPISSGPARFAGLPGIILAVGINNGQLMMTAVKISLQEIDNKIIVKPSDGKKVTKEEFDKIRADKQKEMQDQEGGDGNVVIKIRK